jgi:hypothetical protein
MADAELAALSEREETGYYDEAPDPGEPGLYEELNLGVPNDLELICFRCGRPPQAIPGYVDQLRAELWDDGEESPSPAELVRQGEGTYNPETGHFCCDQCYLAIGMPANRFPEPPWRAP